MFNLGKVTLAAAAVAAMVATTPASAGDSNGNFQAKLGVTGVLTDDNTKTLDLNGKSLLPGSWASTNDTVIPSLTLTYYLNKNLALELFCCFDKVHVQGEGGIAGFGDIASTWIFPPILTAQYHFDGMGAFRPYLGVGVEYIHYFNSKSEGGLAGTDVHFSDSWGFALQGGVDYDLGNGLSLGLDVKKVWEDTKVTWRTAGTEVVAKHDIDPLFITANIGYRFNLSDLLGGREAPAPLK